MFSPSVLESMYRGTGGVQATAEWLNGPDNTSWGHLEEGDAITGDEGRERLVGMRTFVMPTARLARAPFNRADTVTISGTTYRVVDHHRSEDGLDTFLTLGDA